MTLIMNGRSQITLPREVRERLNIKQGDRLLVDVQDGIMILIPQPESYIDHLQGLNPEIWKKVDGEKYLNSERESW